MHSRSITALFVFASCLMSPCLADDETVNVRPMTIDQLTRGRASQLLANTDAVGEDLARQIKNVKSPTDASTVDDLSGVLSHFSEWRWYSRDRGILLAIPVKERLGLQTYYNGERMLADFVRRIINQRGWGNPPVQVVFIEPVYPESSHGNGIGQCSCHPSASEGG